MDNILDEFRQKAITTQRRAAGLPENWEESKTLPAKPTFKGEDLPSGFPPGYSLPFFPNDPGIAPDTKKVDEYYHRYQNSAPDTVEKLLTEKEEAFCQHYAITRNGAAAARAAGWKPTSAHNTAYRLLMKNTVRQRISHLMFFHTRNDQASPSTALALVMSALQGGPEPDFRLRAARTILEIYKTGSVNFTPQDQEELALALKNGKKNGKNLEDVPQLEANQLNNNTFIQINAPQSSTDLHTASTNLHEIRVDSPPISTPLPHSSTNE
jgi:hypothetical protein